MAEFDATIFKGAVISGVINAVVNGAIQWFLLAENAPLPLKHGFFALGVFITVAVLWQRSFGSVLAPPCVMAFTVKLPTSRCLRTISDAMP